MATSPCPLCGTDRDYREHCPSCGAKTSGLVAITVDGRRAPPNPSDPTEEAVIVTARLGGIGEPTYRTKAGFGTHRKTGQRTRFRREVNKDADRYRELVVDRDTSEEIHRCEEPLTEHRGHGSAKPTDGSR